MSDDTNGQSAHPEPGQSFLVTKEAGAVEIRRIYRYDDVSGDGRAFVVTDQQGRLWLLNERDNREPGPAYAAVRELNTLAP